MTTQAMKLTRIHQKLYQLLHLLFGLFDTRHISKRGLDLVFTQQPRLAFAEGHRAAFASRATLHLTHKKHKHRNNHQDWKASHEQLAPNALLLGLLTLDNYAVVIEIINQLGILQRWTHRHKPTATLQLTTNFIPLNDDSGDLIGAHLLNKL